MSQWMILLFAALQGVVEGFTEYLPVSSTGHLVLVCHWLEGCFGESFHESFEMVIQMGAVLAVLVEYRPRFARLLSCRVGTGFAGLNGWLWLGLTTLPATVVGLLFYSTIKERLFAPGPIALALVGGGVVMIVLERLLPTVEEQSVDEVGWRRALGIGLFQCFSIVPGTSRSMATILGGRLLGLGRRTAAEYSFFAAVPVLMLAGAYDFAKGWGSLQRADAGPYVVGLVVSFVVARVGIRFLMRVVSRYTLAGFGWYRIGLGVLVLWVLR